MGTRNLMILMILMIAAGAASAIDFEGDREIIVDPVVPDLTVDIWTDRGERAVYYPGERIKLYFRVSHDAFVVVYDVDTEGRVKLLFPPDPYRGGRVEGGARHALPPPTATWDMRVAGPTGIEYVVAVASTDPFVWDEYAEQLAGGGVLETIATDPHLGIERINQLIAPVYDGAPYYVSDRTSFYVERRVPYPRYMCYDCHSPWHWDPYYAVCPAFEIVIYSRYDDYYYRPPHNPWGRRPYYWYKRKLNREYPTVKYKYASGGRDFWEGRSKRQWIYPQATKEKQKEREERGGAIPREESRWKDPTGRDRPPDRPSAPTIRVKSPPVEPRREKEVAPREEAERDSGRAEPQVRDTPASPESERIQTRPFYREKEPPREGRTDKGESRPHDDSSAGRTREKQ